MLRTYGDSITMGGQSGAAPWPGMLGEITGLAVSNLGFSGAQPADLITALFGIPPMLAMSDISTLMFGWNDAYYRGMAPLALQIYQEALQTAAAFLSFLPSELSMLNLSGSWSIGGLQHRTLTQGSYAEFTFVGSVGYLGGMFLDPDAGSYRIDLDGTPWGTFNTSPGAYSGWQSVNQQSLGGALGPRLHRIVAGGSMSATHSVRVTKTSAGSGNDSLFVYWGAGNGAARGRPLVLLATPTPAAQSAYGAIGSVEAILARGRISRHIATMLASDGLNVAAVDTFSAVCCAADDLESGVGPHMTTVGNGKLAHTFLPYLD